MEGEIRSEKRWKVGRSGLKSAFLKQARRPYDIGIIPRDDHFQKLADICPLTSLGPQSCQVFDKPTYAICSCFFMRHVSHPDARISIPASSTRAQLTPEQRRTPRRETERKAITIVSSRPQRRSDGVI